MKTFLRILLYGFVLGGLLLLLTWAKYRLLLIDHATELYVLLVATLFTAVGIWAGLRWSVPRPVENRLASVAPAAQPVSPLPRRELLDRHGISPREWEVLVGVAQGFTNEEIARNLFVSANTVKTHLGNLYGKLDVNRRTQAIEKARSLGLLS